MEYLLFTYPNCPKCDKVKAALAANSVAYSELSLTQQAGKARVREFIRHLRRDDSGGVIIPTLIVHTQGVVRAVINTAEELEAWLRSKA
jgi:glutaredoxin